MFNNCVYRCARWRGSFGAAGLALVVLVGLDYSHSFATSIGTGSFFDFDFGSDPGHASVELKVSDKAGPITVDYEDLGTHNGLPTIKIREKLRQPDGGGEVSLWSDVEIEICIDVEGGSPIDDIIDDIKDIIDDIFGFLNHKDNQHSISTWGGDHGDDDEEEDDFQNGLDILVKKYVKNKAGVLFPNYRMVLGTGVGDDFVPSDPNDGLYFLTSPAPTETTNYFQDPPLADGPYSDYLIWTSDGVTTPGLDHYDEASFRVGVHVPRDLFEEDGDCCDGLVARFTIRQHAEVPEPTALGLTMLGLIAGSGRRGRRR